MPRDAQPDFQGVPLDTWTIPPNRLNIDNKERSNLFPWKGQFSPQLVEALLQTYAERGSFVLDPFLGSGRGAGSGIDYNLRRDIWRKPWENS